MAGFPTFKLYESDGTTLVYEFDNVTNINDWQDPSSFVEYNSLRGQGSIISEGSQEPWDLNMEFLLIGDDYEDLVSQIADVKDTIEKFHKYVLKVQLTTGGSTEDYKVMRLGTFLFPLNNNKKRVNFQTVQSTFRVDCWS